MILEGYGSRVQVSIYPSGTLLEGQTTARRARVVRRAGADSAGRLPGLPALIKMEQAYEPLIGGSAMGITR